VIDPLFLSCPPTVKPDPTYFKNNLDLASKLDPTPFESDLNLFVKLDPTAFGTENKKTQRPQHHFLTKNSKGNAPMMLQCRPKCKHSMFSV